MFRFTHEFSVANSAKGVINLRVNFGRDDDTVCVFVTHVDHDHNEFCFSSFRW